MNIQYREHKLQNETGLCVVSELRSAVDELVEIYFGNYLDECLKNPDEGRNLLSPAAIYNALISDNELNILNPFVFDLIPRLSSTAKNELFQLVQDEFEAISDEYAGGPEWVEMLEDFGDWDG